MFRALLLSVSCLTVSACVSSGTLAPAEILARAEADTQLRKEIDTLSTYAVAKYAGLTDDPQTSARHYARLLRQVQDDPWVAEQAIFSILRTTSGQSGRVQNGSTWMNANASPLRAS